MPPGILVIFIYERSDEVFFIVVLLGLVAAAMLAKVFFYVKAKSKNAVSEIQTVDLNGAAQRILVEGKEDHLPVLILLHGGPGVAFPFGACCRGALPQLTDNFITVYWDQYGCGNNYKKLPPDFCISDYDKMVADLIDHMAACYPGNKIYLFGLSWGSLLAAHTAACQPARLDGVITYGQVLSFAQNNRVAAGALEKCDLTAADRETLEKAKNLDVAGSKDMLDDLLDKYTNGSSYKGKDASNQFFMKLWPILFSPDYSLRKHLLAQTGYLNTKNNTKILQELAETDVRKELAGVRIPYHILQGAHDLTTSTPLVAEFVKNANNPLLDLQVYEKSSHMPSGGDLEDILHHIAELVACTR